MSLKGVPKFEVSARKTCWI